jgi:hypothetical protein
MAGAALRGTTGKVMTAADVMAAGAVAAGAAAVVTSRISAE